MCFTQRKYLEAGVSKSNEKSGIILTKIKIIIFITLIDRFVCEKCHQIRQTKRIENRFTAKRLQVTRLGTFIETRVNNFLRKKEAESGEVYIRVVFSGDKNVEVKGGMKKR